MVEVEGRSSRDRIAVTTNVFRIPERLKEIDPHFFVMLHRKTGVFEIHDSCQQYGTLACSLPFEELDARALEYVRANMHQDVLRLAKLIDEENERLERKRYDALMDRAQYKTRDIFRYLDNNTKTDAIPREAIVD